MRSSLSICITILIFLLSISHDSFTQNWHSIGPSEKPLSMCMSNDYILFGTQQSGILRSTDAGISWQYSAGMPPVAYGSLPSNTITCLVHDPYDASYVYAGTGPDETATGHGFFKSTDGGKTWQSKSKGLNSWPAIFQISVNPFNTDELYLVSTAHGIYRSADKGETWSSFYNYSATRSTIIFNPSDSTTKYSVDYHGTVHIWHNQLQSDIVSKTNFFSPGRPVNIMLNPKSGSLFFVSNTDLYRWNSKDTWVSLLDSIQINGEKINLFEGAAIDQKSGTVLVCSDQGVFRSTDDGQHWTLVNSSENMNIAIDSNKIILAGFQGIILSTDGGTLWSRISDGPKISSVYSTSLFHSQKGTTIYTIGQVFNSVTNVLYKSTDDGLTWRKLSLPNGASPTVIKSNPLNPNTVYAGCGAFYVSNLGLYKSMDGGNNWKQILSDSKIPVTAINIAKNDTSRIVLGCPGIIRQSTDCGNNWEDLLQIQDSYSEINVVKLSAVDLAKIFIGTSSNSQEKCGFFVTTDSGYHWELRVNGLPDGLEYKAITAIGVHPKNDNIIYIGNNATLFKSTDMGASWGKCGFPDFFDIAIINDIQFVPDDPNMIFVSVRGISVGRGGLFYSDDGGNSWKEIDFPNATDQARTFINILPLENKYRIYIGTLSYGLYVGEIPKTTSFVKPGESVPNKAALLQNYPNPFNPTTTISYTLPKRSYVELKVFDMLGQEVTTLVKREQNSGEYKVQFDGSSLPSGIYVYTIHAGEYRSSRKLMLMK